MDVNFKICGSIGSQIKNRCFLFAMCSENQPRWRRLLTINLTRLGMCAESQNLCAKISPGFYLSLVGNLCVWVTTDPISWTTQPRFHVVLTLLLLLLSCRLRLADRFKSFSSRISQQNAHFSKYIETSKRQEDFLCKNSKLKCFKTTNFDRFHSHKFSSFVSFSHPIVKYLLTLAFFPERVCLRHA